MPKKPEKLADPRVWIKDLDIESTEDIAVPKMLVDQVIGQEQGVETVSYTHLTLPTIYSV